MPGPQVKTVGSKEPPVAVALRLRIAVADDGPNTLEFFREMLTRLGHP